MAIEGLFGLIIEPLLWSLVVFFSLQTIIVTFNNADTKAKKYAIVTSVLVFLLVISDDIMRMIDIMRM
ncbi:hypothetical protein LSPCS325_34400 [Lysinibacillus sp. CTST325]|uniref:hypothetical protein n=1 Tax=unclassified Lysinibacillus TaxID=2636778 RepID=UPI0009A690C8|nr:MULTISPECIES: hypothetical protein [unclassified Lysinibacillus]OXS68497.1 hypothetical protein B1B04_20430 [Lysinibacillus sp. KCTC 33748]SKC10283.1 hypothetical protein SAMN06295926_12319 [Lysinibacillus sp. AC-3]